MLKFKITINSNLKSECYKMGKTKGLGNPKEKDLKPSKKLKNYHILDDYFKKPASNSSDSESTIKPF